IEAVIAWAEQNVGADWREQKADA
ncbi:MAG: hypothetical protein JWQ55_1124, partial [Rhodopila sp.]|nr:hypothetical protein [Rhodopila sp.]